MSEAVKESITGVLDGITEKPSGWTDISVRVEGWQHPVRMSTKLQPLIELARAAGSEEMVWTFKKQESDQINPNSGKPYINRYFEGVEPASSVPASEDAPLQATVTSNTAPSQMSKEEWAAKDSAIHKMACIKTAADALKHTLPSDPTPQDLNQFLERTAHLYSAWHRAVIAERDDPTGQDVPF